MTRTHPIPGRAAKLLAVTATVLASAALPAPALAAKDVGYAVELQASGTYEHSMFEPDGIYSHGEDVNLTFDFAGQIGEPAVFRNGRLFAVQGDDRPNATVRGTTQHYGGGGSWSCSGSDDYASRGLMRFAGLYDETNGDPIPLDGEEHVFLRPFDRLEPLWHCGGDSNFQWDLATVDLAAADYDDDGSVAPGKHPFDAAFSLPPDAIGPGYVEQLIPERVLQGTACPKGSAAHTTKCTLKWSGKVILRKLWEREVALGSPPSTGPGPAAPPAPRPPAPADDDIALVPLVPATPPKPPASSDDEFLVPLVPSQDEIELVPLVPAGKASLNRTAAQARFLVSCAVACSGTATLTAASRGGARAAARAKPLARKRFALAAGKSRSFALRLSPGDRRAVRRAGGARLAVRTTAAGRTTTRTLRLRLPARRGR